MALEQMASSIGGYTCARCNAFIPNGVVHQCPGTYYPPQVNPPAQATKVDHGFRYAAALERIAAALEKIAEKLDAVA